MLRNYSPFAVPLANAARDLAASAIQIHIIMLYLLQMLDPCGSTSVPAIPITPNGNKDKNLATFYPQPDDEN